MIQNSPKEEKVQIREVMRVFIKKAKINVSLIRERDFKDRVKKKKCWFSLIWRFPLFIFRSLWLLLSHCLLISSDGTLQILQPHIYLWVESVLKKNIRQLIYHIYLHKRYMYMIITPKISHLFSINSLTKFVKSFGSK